jgi:CRP-like cAMP-binding protein
VTNQNPRPITTEPAEGDLAPTTELLAGLEILRSLPETDFEVPSRYTSRDTLIPGEPITCGDDRVTDVYVIVRGEVEIADHTFVAEGHVHTEPHLLGAGKVIVWSAIIEHNDYIAATDVELRKIPGPKLLEFLCTRPQAGVEVMAETAAARLRHEAAREHGRGRRMSCPLCPPEAHR